MAANKIHADRLAMITTNDPDYVEKLKKSSTRCGIWLPKDKVVNTANEVTCLKCLEGLVDRCNCQIHEMEEDIEEQKGYIEEIKKQIVKVRR